VNSRPIHSYINMQQIQAAICWFRQMASALVGSTCFYLSKWSLHPVSTRSKSTNLQSLWCRDEKSQQLSSILESFPTGCSKILRGEAMRRTAFYFCIAGCYGDCKAVLLKHWRESPQIIQRTELLKPPALNPASAANVIR
jgi:hypothetical protein